MLTFLYNLTPKPPKTNCIPTKKNSVQLKKWLIVLVAINLVIAVTRVFLSYCLATIAPLGLEQPRETAFFRFLSDKLGLGLTIQALVTGDSVFQHEPVFAAAVYLPTFISTVVFIVLLILLVKNKEEITDDCCSFIFRWSVVVALISGLAVPVLAQDFWLSLAWGKMVGGGGESLLYRFEYASIAHRSNQ